MKGDDALLLDMLLAAQDARAFVATLDWPAFAASRLHQSAVIRALEVLGEAASKVAPVVRDRHPDLPWRQMIGMRHRLIHAYGEVRTDIVWEVVQERLPALIERLAVLVPPG